MVQHTYLSLLSFSPSITSEGQEKLRFVVVAIGPVSPRLPLSSRYHSRPSRAPHRTPHSCHHHSRVILSFYHSIIFHHSYRPPRRKRVAVSWQVSYIALSHPFTGTLTRAIAQLAFRIAAVMTQHNYKGCRPLQATAGHFPNHAEFGQARRFRGQNLPSRLTCPGSVPHVTCWQA